MINIKPGASIRGISPEIALAVAVINSVMQGETLTITCCTDGKHRDGSLHYVGHAIDIRSRDMKNPQATANDFRAALGDDYDVVVEATHIHIEYQPEHPLNSTN